MVATAKDLRFNISMLFDVIDKKEDVIITYRGKPKAKLISFEDNSKIENEKLFGIWKDRNDDVKKYMKEIRKARNFVI